MHLIDFNELPRTTRELFVRSLASDAPSSSPICRRTSVQRSSGAWFLLMLLSLGGLAIVAYPKFAAIASPVQGPKQLAIYVALFAIVGLALSMISRRRALKGSLPFLPGVYVFPLDLVDARTRELELYPLAELQSIDPVHHVKGGNYTHTSLWFVFPTQSFVFEVRSRDRAEMQLQQITQARHEISASMQRGYPTYDPSLFDPFADARSRNWEPAHEYGLLARGRPMWTRFIWAITIVTGLVGGVAGWRVRNWQSDERAFAKIRSKPDVTLGEQYIRGGGLRSAEMKNAVLPRARLTEAKKEPAAAKRADNVDRFLRAYPKTAVEGEARTALAEAQHAEFLSETTVAGLRGFVTRWPESADTAAVKAKIHDLHQQALVDFRAHANTTDKNIGPVIEAMLISAEDHNGAVDVRVRRRNAASLMTTDKLLVKGLLDDDGVAAKSGNAEIAPHFTSDHIADREVAMVKGFERSFATVFPADLFVFRVGMPIPPTDAAAGKLPDVTQVTIVIDYEVTWNGATYVARDAARRFVGFSVKLDVSLLVPNKDTHVATFSVKADQPDSFNGIDPAVPSSSSSSADDAHVYDAMMIHAFDGVGAKLIAILFDAKTAALRSPTEPTN